MIPTVRVANAASPTGFATINAADYREMVHGPLWHTQAPDYVGLPVPAPANYSAGERDFAGALMLDFLAFDAERGPGPAFSTLSPAQRMVVLRDKRTEFDTYRAQWHQDRSRETRDLFDSTGKVSGSVPVPGETPGFPIDSVTGKPLDLDNETRERLGAIPLKAEGEPVPDATGDVVEPAAEPGVTLSDLLGSQPEAPPPAPAAPEPTAPPAGTPSWAATPPAPPAGQPTVEKGPGSKWYVMRDGTALSEGFKTKAEAEGALPNHNTAS